MTLPSLHEWWKKGSHRGLLLRAWSPCQSAVKALFYQLLCSPGRVSNKKYCYQSEFISFLSTCWWKFRRQTTENQPISLTLKVLLANKVCSARQRHSWKFGLNLNHKSSYRQSYLAWPAWEEASTFARLGYKQKNQRRRAVCCFSQKRRWAVSTLLSLTMRKCRSTTGDTEKLCCACAKI